MGYDHLQFSKIPLIWHWMLHFHYCFLNHDVLLMLVVLCQGSISKENLDLLDSHYINKDDLISTSIFDIIKNLFV